MGSQEVKTYSIEKLTNDVRDERQKKKPKTKKPEQKKGNYK